MQTDKPETDTRDFELERFLPYRLSLLTNTVSQGIAASYRDGYGISVTEWRILAVLGRYPGLAASEVVDRTAMDKVAIHRAVKSLVQKNLLERRTDQADRRRQQLHITPGHGRATLEAIIPRARAFENNLLESLSPEEAKAFLATLEKLQARASELK